MQVAFLLHTQENQGTQTNTRNFQIIENLRETQKNFEKNLNFSRSRMRFSSYSFNIVTKK